MGNDSSKPTTATSTNSATGMGSRANTNNVGMGRRTTSSFNSGSFDGISDSDSNRLRATAASSAVANQQHQQVPRNLHNRNPPGNASGPARADLFESPRTVFLEFSYAPSRDSPVWERELVGRIEIDLFSEVHKAAEQFFVMCTGERGMSASTPGLKLHFKDTFAHRIVPGFLVCQAGDIAKHNGTGTESIYPGEKIENEYPGRSGKHFPYCVACAHAGVGSNWSSQFYILSGKCHGSWLDNHNQVFGKVVKGQEICDMIESYGDVDDGQAIDGAIIITDCGETEESSKRQQQQKQQKRQQLRHAKNNVNVTAAAATAAVVSRSLSLPPATGMPPAQPNIPNDFIYFEFQSDGISAGRRVVIELFTAALPRTAENCRVIASGERSDYKLNYRGSPVHRQTPGFCVQMGDCERYSGAGGVSIYGSRYFDDEGYLPHFTGCVATATSGRNKNNSQFYILTAPDTEQQLRQLDGRDVVFGRVVDGWSTVMHMEKQFETHFVVSKCGQLAQNEIPTTQPTDCAPGAPPLEAYASWLNHPRTRHLNPDLTATSPKGPGRSNIGNNDDDDDGDHHQQVQQNRNQNLLPSASASASTTTTFSGTALIPNAPNGVINPPFVRAFDNGQLPAEMQSFVQDFLRMIECPVCLCTFDGYSRVPYTAHCGHSWCLTHCDLLKTCPLCREEIKGNTSDRSKIKPNLVLRDICAKFGPTDLESVEAARRAQERAKTPPKTRNTNLLATTERSRLDLSAPPGPSLHGRPLTPERQPSRPGVVITTGTSIPGPRTLVLTSTAASSQAASAAASSSNNKNNNNYNIFGDDDRHQCPLKCDIMRSQHRCCACMDKRPRLMREFGYPNYVDGRGDVNNAARWQYYCPCCKSSCERAYYLKK